MTRRLAGRIALGGGIVIICLTTLLPIIWTFLTSLETREEVYRFPPNLVPGGIPLPELLGDLWRLAVSGLRAEQYNRHRRGHADYHDPGFLGGLCLFHRDIPREFLADVSRADHPHGAGHCPGDPLYILAQRFGVYDTRGNLILLYLVTTLPLAIWFLKTSFDAVPQSILDAARIDGCTEIRILYRIFLPTAAPGLVTTLVVTFLTNWMSSSSPRSLHRRPRQGRCP